jgi:VanZ family protein
LKTPLPWRIALTAYLAGLAIVGFWPTPVDKPIFARLSAVLKYLHGHGVPAWFDYHFVEASANVAMFVPLGILAAMALPTKTWWRLAAIGLLASLCMEVGQLLFISARFSSALDVVMNTCGAVIGITSPRLLTRIATSNPVET